MVQPWQGLKTPLLFSCFAIFSLYYASIYCRTQIMVDCLESKCSKSGKCQRRNKRETIFSRLCCVSVARAGLEIEHLQPLGYIDRLVKSLEKASLEVLEFLKVSPIFERSKNK